MGTDGVCADINMVATWMLCGKGDGVCVDVNMVATWMLWETSQIPEVSALQRNRRKYREIRHVQIS